MIEITEISQFDEVLEKSGDSFVFIYKHSDMCGTAWHAEGLVNDAVQELAGDPVEFVKVEVRKARDLSSAIADRFEIRHESPQAILLLNSKVVWHASHGGIRTRRIVEAVRENAPGAASETT
jgi:bacillithiol system protein YtxJ